MKLNFFFGEMVQLNKGCTRYLVPVGQISGHFLKSGSGSSSSQNGISYQIFQPDSDWSFMAVSSPIKSAAWSHY